MTTVTLTTATSIAAAARSRLYALLADGFRFPTPSVLEAVRTGRFAHEVQAAAREAPYPLALEEKLGAGAGPGFEELGPEYIGLFDVGGPRGAPCFLYEGEHGGARLKVLEDVLRFYHYFGLHLAAKEGRRDRPDHLSTELEFLHVLTFRESARLGEEKDAGSYRLAERDFLRLHLVDLVDRVAATIAPRRVPFYSELAAVAQRFCEAELAYVSSC